MEDYKVLLSALLPRSGLFTLLTDNIPARACNITLTNKHSYYRVRLFCFQYWSHFISSRNTWDYRLLLPLLVEQIRYNATLLVVMMNWSKSTWHLSALSVWVFDILTFMTWSWFLWNFVSCCCNLKSDNIH